MSSFDKDVQRSQAYKAEGRTILFLIFVGTTEETFMAILYSE